jgi:hypothetical protein
MVLYCLPVIVSNLAFVPIAISILEARRRASGGLPRVDVALKSPITMACMPLEFHQTTLQRQKQDSPYPRAAN